MTTQCWVAAAFPQAGDRIAMLRSTDASFDEACTDFAELSELMDRLSRSGSRDAGTLEDMAASLAELKLELTARLGAAEAGGSSPTAKGDIS